MKPILGAALTVGMSLGFPAAPSMATTRVGVFAIVDEVSFEPSEHSPERVWISGVFVVPTPVSSGEHEPPSRGHLYFGLNPESPEATRRDWEALEEAAGTGRVVGFGAYWVPRIDPRLGTVNSSLEVQVHATRGDAAPEPYPMPGDRGVVTAFDTMEDTCPRFGKPSGEIIVGLREAYGADDATPLDDVPACEEWQGLVPSSRLASTYPTQARNPAWAEAAERMIYSRIAEAPGLELSDFLVECRETICRLRFVFPTEEYQRTSGETLVANALNEMPEFSTSGEIVFPDDGTPTVEYYLQYVPVTGSAAAASTSTVTEN